MHPKYSVQPGIVDVDHLELVAFVKVAKGSWMPHFRLIPPPRGKSTAPPRGKGVCIPQRRYDNGAGYGLQSDQSSVSFFRQDGSYISVTAALKGDYIGLVNRDLPPLHESIFTITLQLQVNRSYRLR